MLRAPFIAFPLLLSSPALAQEVPPMPRERPESLAAPAAPADAPAAQSEAAAPAPEQAEQPSPGDPAPPAAAEPAPATAQAPPAEPARPYQTQCPAVISGQIQASLLPPISEGECGEQSPLSVTGILVNGRMVPLSGEATLSCQLATTLPQWGEALDGFLQSRENTELATINIGTSYSCRERVGGTSDRMSEHGRADALDVVGFSFADGRTLTVEGDWPAADAPEGKFLRFAHDAACSSFSTTLGPEANAEHHDHFHLDMGCHGSTCEARLCE